MLGKKHLLFFILICVVSLTGCTLFGVSGPTLPNTGGDDSGGETGSDYGTLAGMVYHAGFSDAKLQAGQVEIDGRTVPIKNGVYEIENLPNGTYTMRVTKQWYKPAEIQVVVQGATIQNVEMIPDLTFNELDLFARLVHSESQGEIETGQIAVAATVLNRVLHPDYPNTISGVINEVTIVNGVKYYQYEPILNGRINLPAGTTAKNAVKYALAGVDPTYGATGFFAHKLVPQYNSSGRRAWVWEQWDKDPYKIRIGNHSFFR
jgi:hypothetical protein